MTKMGTRERYLIIFALLLVCVIIVASAGLEIAKQNEDETVTLSLAETPDDISTESTGSASKPVGSVESPLNSSSLADGDQSTEPVGEPVNETATDQSSEISDKVTMSISVELEYVSPEEMSDRSDVILIGTVKGILPAQWNTADGESPTDDINELEWCDIYTDVVITVDEYLKNPLDEKEVIVRTLGGEKDIIIIDVEGELSFAPGEKVFLFLKNDTWPRTMDHGPEHFMVTGVSQGKITLTDDGKATSFGEPLTLDELLGTI